MSRLAILLATLIAASSCGNLESKPSEPVPNGGPGTTPNNGFFGNNGNNGFTNNISSNNGFTNNSANIAVNNVAPNNSGNNVAVCGDGPQPPEVLRGFGSPPPFTEGVVDSVLGNELIVASNDSERVSFIAQELNLDSYFARGETVQLIYNDTGNSLVQAVFGQSAFVEVGERVVTGENTTGPASFDTFTGINYAQLESTAPVTCQTEGPCGLQPRTIDSPAVVATSPDFELLVEPFALETFDGGEAIIDIFVAESTWDAIEPVFADECEAPGATRSAITVFTAGIFTGT
jgi:hypothetical protein